MYAVIQTGGKQYKVSVGDQIYIEKVDINVDDVVNFDQVLAIDSKFGNPVLKNANVTGKVLKSGKAKKVTVYKYKPKSNSKTKYGHRQSYTKVEITDITFK